MAIVLVWFLCYVSLVNDILSGRTPRTKARAVSRALGSKFYESGRPCVAGHVGPRYTANASCVACQRIVSQRPATTTRAYRNASVKKWYREHLSVARLRSSKNTARRKAQKVRGSEVTLDDFDDLVVTEAFALARRRQQCTGIPWHVDHTIPLQADQLCGLHVGINLQVIPALLNMQKGNRMIYTEPNEWLSAL